MPAIANNMPKDVASAASAAPKCQRLIRSLLALGLEGLDSSGDFIEIPPIEVLAQVRLGNRQCSLSPSIEYLLAALRSG
ncbi:hypothetical protein [Azotobacter salinestris]|uniref:hypothetical protein n=1 Tax=Azotobacter salinestris TaxID=69964 RepID=UPI00142F04B9|nr:hypothetical protein [Azotobacter salinestris]